MVVISDGLAHRLWGVQDPAGKRIKLGREEENEPWRTVVGVVGDIKQSSFDREPAPTTYVPFDQVPQSSSTLVMRTAGDPIALATAARAVVLSIDPDQPPYDMRTVEQRIGDNDSGVQFSARMMLVFGAIALVLSAAGIFAVMTYSVRQRTHELGVRMALGAQRTDMLRLVIAYALKLSLAGFAIGLPCALALTRALSSFLFGIIRMDMPVYLGFMVLLALAAAAAAYIPAQWATKVDPIIALRSE